MSEVPEGHLPACAEGRQGLQPFIRLIAEVTFRFLILHRDKKLGNRGRVFAFDIHLIPSSIFFVIFLNIPDIPLSLFAFFSNLLAVIDTVV